MSLILISTIFLIYIKGADVSLGKGVTMKNLKVILQNFVVLIIRPFNYYHYYKRLRFYVK